MAFEHVVRCAHSGVALGFGSTRDRNTAVGMWAGMFFDHPDMEIAALPASQWGNGEGCLEAAVASIPAERWQLLPPGRAA